VSGDRTVKAILKADVSSLVNGMRQAEKATTDFAKKSSKSATDNKADWQLLGRTAMVAGGLLAVGVGLAVKSFADFDQKMSGVKAVSGATAGEMDKLSKAAIKAGQDTKYSASESATAEAELAKAGISVADILGGALLGSLNLAAAGNLDLATAATISAQAMNIFKLKGSDVGHIADVLAAGANKSAADVTQLGEAMKQGGLVAAQTGLSFEETVGALSAFADSALVGSDAGTSLKSMLQRLTPQSAQAQKEMDRLGFSAYDAQGNFIGLKGLAGELSSSFSGLTVEQRNASLGIIFGSDAVRGANVLYQQGAAGIDTYTKAVDDNGAAARMSAIQMDNLAGDLEQLKGSIETALIQAGSGGNDALRSLAQTAMKAVNAFGGLPAPVQKSALGLAAVTSAGLLTVGAIGTMYPKVVETKRALDRLAGSSKFAGGAMKGLGKAAGIAAALAATLAVISAISNATQTAVPGIEATTAALLSAGSAAGSSGASIAAIDNLFKGVGGDDTWSSPVDNLAQAFRRLTDKNTMESLNDNIDGVIGMTDAATKSTQVFNNIGTALASLVSSGHADQASAQFDAMAKKLGLTGAETNQLMHLMPAYGESLAGVSNDAKLASGGTDTLATAQTDLATETQKAKDAIDAEVQALQDSGLMVLSTRAATRDFAQAQRDATAALKENGKSLADGTVKGDANRAALDKVASSALGLADSIYKQTGSEDKMRGSLIKSRAALVETAMKFGMTKAQANAYADSIIKIPAHKTTQVELDSAVAKAKAKELQAQINAIVQGKVPGLSVDNAAGKAKIAALQKQIDALHGKKIAINVNTHSYSTGPGGSGGPVAGSAAGGYIRGPGTTTSDSIPSLLSDKEYVVKAKAVDYYGVGTMDAINSMRFAAGGYVGQRSTVSAAGPSLVGVAIEGTLDMGNGLIGVMRGVVKSEMAESGAKLRYAGVS